MKTEKMGRVAGVAQAATQKSATDFKLSQQRHQASCDQLAQLEQFKREYEQKLEAMSEGGMPARQLQDFRVFLANLNQAIEQQGKESGMSQQSLDSAREVWLKKTQRSSSLDQLVEQLQTGQRRDRDKAEQRDADEKSMGRNGADF
tara:strand:- start:43565 stop:44002 length:438 start_codon:yes stop_codon:yes gene_type:complete